MNKLTDNEIVKALECCIDCKCKECPCYKNIEGEMYCTEIDEEEIIDLINRQKAEIERLNIELQSMRSAANSYKWHYETAKSEAIKEFAERLKEKASRGFWDELAYADVDDIDNLVKEMTEVNEDE